MIMEKPTNIFSWTYQLECPPTICNDSVKKILCSGLVGLLWDDLADVIFNAESATAIRKNILLHRLRRGESNKVIQCIRNISQLKLEKNDLKNQISKLEDEYEQQDFIVRQKVRKLREISSKRTEIRGRRDLLKMKHDQTSAQLRDCGNMRLVCQHLMPRTCKDLDRKILMEMLEVTTSLWTGADKRQVWKTLLSNLDHIEVPTLWLHLYQNLTEGVDSLTKSETMTSLDTDEKKMNIGIARICAQHISTVSKRLGYNAKAYNYQQNVLEFIDKIETASSNSTDVSEWLALALEVRKLESEQQSLQEEIDEIQNGLQENNTVAFDLAQLTSEIQAIDAEIAEYIQNLQQSLHLLKCAPTFLMKTKEKINLELQEIITMRANNCDTRMLNNDLTTELDIFYNVLNLNAVRKIMLKGDIGVYRHAKSCFSEASVSITNSQFKNIIPYFPFIQTPIYSLIDCYKNLILMFTYRKFKLEIEENTDSLQLSIQHEENNYNTLELLNLSKVINAKTRAEIDEFKDILNAWVNQTVRKVMEIIEKTVDDATFPEWTERYDLLLYVLQNST